MLWMLLACNGDTPSEEAVLSTISYDVTWESVHQLGPHRFQVTAVHEGANERTSAMLVDWGDWDNFSVEHLRGGELVRATRVVQGTAYTGKPGAWQRWDDAEIYRTELATTWNAWERELEAFAGAVALEPMGETVVEGRPAERYALVLDIPDGPRARTADIPTALSGELVLDKETGVRLQGHAEGSYLKRGEDDKPCTVSVDLERSAIGEVPEIKRPKLKKGRKKRKGSKAEGPKTDR